MTPFRACLVILAMLLIEPVQADAPQRIVSLNLCTDAMLLELVDKERIASLTYLSRDPGYATWSGQARDIPINHGLIEEILPLAPDLILAGSFGARPTVQLLERLGYRVERFEAVTSVADYRTELRRLADLTGSRARAEQLLERLDRRLAALRPATGTLRPGAIVFQANGFSAGAGSLIDDLLRHAGLTNLAIGLGIGPAGRLGLESLLLADPQLLIIGEYRPDEPARGQQLLHHPALAALLERPGPRQRITIPARWWNCAGASMLSAVEELVGARQRLLAGDD